MQNFIRSLNYKLTILIVSIVLVIVVAVIVQQYLFFRQRDDSELIQLAGSQSTLIQKLTKISLYIEKDLEVNKIDSNQIKSLQHFADSIHQQQVIFTSYSQTYHSNVTIDSILAANTPAIELIRRICFDIQLQNQETVQKAIAAIHSYGERISIASEQLLLEYQRYAEKKMSVLKTTQYALGISIFLVLVGGFIYILLPSIKNLRKGYINLGTLNAQLRISNEKLLNAQNQTSENLEHIQRLNDDLLIKEDQYRRLIESSDNIIYELDEHGLFIFVNPVTEQITGFSKETLYTKLFWEIVHPNYKDAVIQFYFQQRKKKQEHSYYELPILTSARKTVWLGQSVSMFYTGPDNLAKSSVIARDITNLKMIQLKLENSEKLYRLLSTNSKDLVSLYNYVDDTPILTYISPSVKDILGYSAEEFIGRSPFDIIFPDDVKEIRDNSYPSILKGKPTKSEYRVYKKDGTIVWLESYAEPFFDNEGKVIGFQTSARDITQRIDNASKLNDAKEKAEDAALAKSQFLSMMSHEIRTPLNGVIGLTNFLLEENPSEDQLKYLKLLKFSGNNLLAIINDILDFSKIEANQIQLEDIPFNLHALMENALQTLKIRASDKGLPLMLSYDSKLPDVVKGDPVRISQIINNLVSNAIKFTEVGFISVQILFSGKSEDKYSIIFSVKDTGIGIPVDKLDYIFESFTQATPDTARKFGGTGLGLSITKRLVKLMGGNITTVSELGKGTEFTFSLDLEEAQLLNSEFQEERVYCDDKTRSFSILLVDDNDVNLIVASNYLKKWGFKVTTAENGKEALSLVVHKTFHLVLMDLQMPEMDGYQASLKIREMPDPYFNKVPIIALTASAMIEDIQRLSKCGINDYVAKPFHPQDLYDKIIKYALVEAPVNIESSGLLLDEYSAGSASQTKLLAMRMVDNLKELQEALNHSVESKSEEFYRKALHKMQTTLSIINDPQFKDTLDSLKDLFGNRKEILSRLMVEMDQFTRQSNEHISRLLEKVKENS